MRSRHLRAIALCLTIGGVIVLGLANAAWATPTQRPSGQTVPTLTPGGQTPTAQPISTPVPTIPSGRPSPSTGSGSESDGILSVRQLEMRTLPPVDDGLILLGQAIQVLMIDENGNPIERPRLANPIQVCLKYTPADLAVVGGVAPALVVLHYDTSPATPTWVALPAKLHTEQSLVCTTTTRLGTFAIAGRPAA